MNTSIEFLQVTKFKELNKYASLLKNNGFDIISSYKKDDPQNSFNSYFYFHKNGFFGYCQKERFEDYSLSTVNKPSKSFGTGHGFKKQWDILTVENATECLNFAKRIIETNFECKNYNSLNEFIYKSLNVKELI